MEKDFWQGVRDALPTALGYISIGLACGVVASPYLSPLEMALMSVLVYAGAALSDCGPLFDLEYGLDRVFDQSPEYVDESAYLL